MCTSSRSPNVLRPTQKEDASRNAKQGFFRLNAKPLTRRVDREVLAAREKVSRRNPAWPTSARISSLLPPNCSFTETCSFYECTRKRRASRRKTGSHSENIEPFTSIFEIFLRLINTSTIAIPSREIVLLVKIYNHFRSKTLCINELCNHENCTATNWIDGKTFN